jgi:hypothetical protein
MNRTRERKKFGYTPIVDFRNADVRCSKGTHSHSIKCAISSSARNTTVVLTRPRLLNASVPPESIRERIEGRWNLVSIKKNENTRTPAYTIDFSGEDNSLEVSLRCDDYQELCDEPNSV